MKFTTVQINLLALALICAVMQGGILWQMNGVLPQLIQDKDLGALALILSPMAGVVWSLRRMAFYAEQRENGASERADKKGRQQNCCRPCSSCGGHMED